MIYSIPVSVSGYAQTIASPRRERWGLTIYNNADSDGYVAFGTGANMTDNYSFVLEPSGFYELPADYYDGTITMIHQIGASGSILVTEWVK